MDPKYLEMNKMVNNLYLKIIFLFISIFNLYLFADFLDRSERLDEFDSEDESEVSDDLCKKDFLPFTYSSSSLMIPEQ